jgi:hypothetical protein
MPLAGITAHRFAARSRLIAASSAEPGEQASTRPLRKNTQPGSPHASLRPGEAVTYLG